MSCRVVIPVAGLGSRLRPHTHTAPKVMLQVAGKPMLGHILDELKKYDVEEITLVIGHLGDHISEYVTKAYDFKFNFVTQDELLGLGHAIWITKEANEGYDGPLLIILGDTIFDADFDSIMESGTNWIGVKDVEDPRRFGVVELEGEKITAMVEKPQNPPSNLAIVGIYYLNQSRMLYDKLDAIVNEDRRTAGEIQLTDALADMLASGCEMKPFRIKGWFDCGKPETLLETNRDLLARNNANAPAGEGFECSMIKPPVAIGKGVTIENSIIGPDVTIADGVTVRNAIVSDSIVSSNASVENIILKSSIIADKAQVKGHTHKLSVGDSSEIKMD